MWLAVVFRALGLPRLLATGPATISRLHQRRVWPPYVHAHTAAQVIVRARNSTSWKLSEQNLQQFDAMKGEDGVCES